MKALLNTVTKKYERSTDAAKLAGMLGFCAVLTVAWLGILFTSGI